VLSKEPIIFVGDTSTVYELQLYTQDSALGPKGTVVLLCEYETPHTISMKEYLRGRLEGLQDIEGFLTNFAKYTETEREQTYGEFSPRYTIRDIRVNPEYFSPSEDSYFGVYMAQPLANLRTMCNTRNPEIQKSVLTASEVPSQSAGEGGAASQGGAASSASQVSRLSSLSLLGTRGKSQTVYEPAAARVGEAQTMFSPVANEKFSTRQLKYRRILSYRGLTLNFKKEVFSSAETVEYTIDAYFEGVAVEVNVILKTRDEETVVYIAGLYNKNSGQSGLAIDLLCIILYTMYRETPWAEEGWPEPVFVYLMALGSGPARGPDVSFPIDIAEYDTRLGQMVSLIAYYKYLGFKRQIGFGYVGKRGLRAGAEWSTNTPYGRPTQELGLNSTYFYIPMSREEVESFNEAVYR